MPQKSEKLRTIGLVYIYGLSVWVVGAATSACAGTDTLDAVTSATAQYHDSAVVAQTVKGPPSFSDSARLSADLKNALQRQYAAVTMHKKLAYATAALVLATDIEGMYHFLAMEKLGHLFRDSLEAATRSRKAGRDPDIQAAGIKQAWLTSESQTLRALHGGLVIASAISYTATATIELTTARLAKDAEGIRQAKLHRNIFYIHAALMAANVALGYAESRALSQGTHNEVVGFGIAHLVVGFSLPIVMIGSGLTFHTSKPR